MQNTINHELAHTYLIKDLAYRSLNFDLQNLNNLKSKGPLEKIYVAAIEKLNAELSYIRKGMQKEGLKLQGEKKLDDLFTVYTFIQKGFVDELRYSNHALKNQTMAEIERLFSVK